MVHCVLADHFSSLPVAASHPALESLDSRTLAVHGADAHLLAAAGGQIAARCSLWWTQVPRCASERLGVVGHYASVGADAAGELLHAALAHLRAHGCTLAVGPMDGNTWRRYRFVTERGSEPPFFLEPTNPDDWPGQFIAAGFAPLAEYTSALNRDLAKEDARLPRVAERMSEQGIVIRALRRDCFEDELRRIYSVSEASFQANFLYTPIEQEEFLAQYRPIEKLIDPRLVLLAEDHDRTVGYVFAIPNAAQAQRGAAVDTVVAKTVAVLPGRAYGGLGNLLVGRVQQEARRLGYRRVIHALMHSGNNSRNLSGHYAETMRRYTLYRRRL